MALTKVKMRELRRGDPWIVKVIVRDQDVSDITFAAQLRPYMESEEILATPQVEISFDDPDTTILLSLSDEETLTIDTDNDRAIWGFKKDRSLWWGELVLKPEVVLDD